MDFIQALILGMVQGALEWLPVSSEGITSLVMINFFGKSLTEAVSIALWLHIGTLAAAVTYFRKEIWSMLKNLKSYQPTSDHETDRLTTFIITATIFTALVGAPIYFMGIEKFKLTGETATIFIGGLLIFTGMMMKLAGRRVSKRKEESFTDGLISGIAQGFSILPGISRSGFTTSVLLLRKHKPEKSLKLSFLISIPAVMGAQILLKMNRALTLNSPMIAGALASFIVGYLTISTLLKIGKRINFSHFVIFIGLLSLSVVLI